MARGEGRVCQHAGGGRKLVKEADALASDVNSIMSKYIQTGILPQGGARPTYGDFTNAVDYHTAMNKWRKAEEDFYKLPPQVRKHVQNDPGKFLEMVYDPERRGELEELGLVEAQAPEAAPDAAEPPPVVEEPQE